jgi:hypothetical protein
MKALLTPAELNFIIDSLNKFKENTSPFELSKLFNSSSSGTVYIPLDLIDNFIVYLTEQRDSGETIINLPQLEALDKEWKGCDVNINDMQYQIIIESTKTISNDYIKLLLKYLHLCDISNGNILRKVIRREFDEKLKKQLIKKEIINE